MPPEQHRTTGDLHTKFGKDRYSDSRDMLADKHTHTETHRQTG